MSSAPAAAVVGFRGREPRSSRIVVVGGGITGLTAAYTLSRQPDPPEVILLEASDRLGGKILTTPFAGWPVDAGADAMLARTPEAIELLVDLGLGDELVRPATDTVYLWTQAGLVPVPDGVVLGIPTNLRTLARSGLVSSAAVARAALDMTIPAGPLPDDESVGELVRRRLGAEILDRLVDPFIGGINAGHPDNVSVQAALPQLDAARRHASLIQGLKAQRAGAAGGQPAFYSLTGGMGRLVEALAGALGDVDIRLWSSVTSLAREPSGYRLGMEEPSAWPDGLLADAVVLAVPSWAAAQLVQDSHPQLGASLAWQDHASVALVTMAYSTSQVAPASRLLAGNGFLVARGEGRLATACTWTTTKWPHLGYDDQLIVRVSAGRIDDHRAGELDDQELIERLAAELSEAIGLEGGPEEVRVTRWERSMPQYAPGHAAWLGGIGQIVAEELPGVILVGASYGGIGIPACIEQGRRAALAVEAHVGASAGTAAAGGEP